ncbi:MAG: squalene/phytoene synthase family protein [Alphaproteobacteria bacterium]|nr:squalene/phytoene synthase family protein [Alphaproteobacteria bacterium]
MNDENFDTLLQNSDPDRRLAALLAPPEQRQRLLTLYAFHHEIAKIAEATSESLIGEMKLTWWRDAVDDLYADPTKVRRHAVTEGLSELTGLIGCDALQGLILARLDDVTARPFADLDEVVAYVDATAVALMDMAVRLCEAELDKAWTQSAGRAWGLAGLLRAFAHRASIGRAPVPGDHLSREGGSAAMMAQGLGREPAAIAVKPVRTAALQAMAEFKALGAIPAAAVPALGYAVLAPAYFKRLPDDPFAIATEPALLGRQLRLSWLALTGR